MAGGVRRRKAKPSRQNSSASASSSHHHTGAKKLQQKNLSLCLARGATARNLHPTLLQPLSADEMEKDLRHMQAYAAAVKVYQQQYYLQAHGPAEQGGATAATSHHPLPVRIDPEEEKRLVNLRKKICRAEVIREEAEQHYVASRAHYVSTVQDLERTSEQRFFVQEFLQKCVTSRAQVVACQRARLQMARDVKDCLTARIEALQHYEDERRRLTDGAPPALFVPHLTGDDPLTTLWNQVEEEYKKSSAACFDKRKKPLVWPATHLTATPPGIPTLASAASIVPDKSCAFAAKNMFDCKDASLVWMSEHFGVPTVDETQEEIQEVERLEHQVERLEQELAKERRLNQQVCQKIGATRARNDEWVAMMAILRQETEAVLHRHNTILQSEKAVAASQRLAEKEEESTKNDGGKTAEEKSAETTAPTDEANYGDDEGGSNIEEDEEDWNNKRPAEDPQDGASRNKRRRL